MFSTGVDELDRLLKDGYPDRSAILVVGPPGIGKEALGYWFMQKGLSQDDFCLYVTRLAVSEVLNDLRAYGIEDLGHPMWVAREEGEIKCEISDLQELSHRVKDAIRKHESKRIRIVTDILSPLLALNDSETIYRFFSQLLSHVKQYNAVLLATIEDGMHQPQVLGSMEQLFDGVVEMRLYEKGLRVLPLLRALKMRGLAPHPEYFRFSFKAGKMEIIPYDR